MHSSLVKTLLYQFKLSHFCEKACFALDYKKVPYQVINLIPGPHLFYVKRIAPKTTLPVLKDGNTIIQDSTEILNYLENKYPSPPLDNEKNHNEIIEWEEYLDEDVGIHLRRYFYFHILPRRKLATYSLTQGLGFFQKCLFWLLWPLIKKAMTKQMRINPESAARSLARLRNALARINLRLTEGSFLVGDSFSRADLTAATLLAPLFFPEKHPFIWPKEKEWPPTLLELRSEYKNTPVAPWVNWIYKQFR
ncbi:MAG: hypothetical protein A3G32_05245 [Deltaproteobacteria bacterium RIFCSPLOWO2_12_FULL_40_28]|nr:MAG: hypothetical protein A3C45_09355 [Deltaproteobacteria bacterium RIFCSPHIGHO2_02_FULL_40_28]OGQ19802.1 MAG: hypothetical protein A3E27_08550 [Deltaproteobacteria bacterium RIFCSPHIGHO2_12_FULL_40_32]OGQ41085.1 MAG: hypothetical protein A3I69_03965 [Deltaproteobacteria bacterium RIFCSPLOWO2_02_FULL_40_36]OGQ54201.1 MAG: hypothetical protein A3G32_05245 [Deltaproteobacteria bacterium RIFCSPLOWO2_12_FULL_40_28]